MSQLKILEVQRSDRIHFFPDVYHDKVEAPWITEIDTREFSLVDSGIRGKAISRMIGLLERLIYWFRTQITGGVVDVQIEDETYALNVHSAANFLERVGIRLRNRSQESVRKWVQLFSQGPDYFYYAPPVDDAAVDVLQICGVMAKVQARVEEHRKKDETGRPQFFEVLKSPR